MLARASEVNTYYPLLPLLFPQPDELLVLPRDKVDCSVLQQGGEHKQETHCHPNVNGLHIRHLGTDTSRSCHLSISPWGRRTICGSCAIGPVPSSFGTQWHTSWEYRDFIMSQWVVGSWHTAMGQVTGTTWGVPRPGCSREETRQSKSEQDCVGISLSAAAVYQGSVHKRQSEKQKWFSTKSKPWRPQTVGVKVQKGCKSLEIKVQKHLVVSELLKNSHLSLLISHVGTNLKTQLFQVRSPHRELLVLQKGQNLGLTYLGQRGCK